MPEIKKKVEFTECSAFAEHYRNLFKQARGEAIDPEFGYKPMLSALEIFGQQLSGKSKSLNDYKPCVVSFLKCHINSVSHISSYEERDIDYLYSRIVRDRNNAEHIGAVRSRLSENLTDLLLMLESACQDIMRGAMELEDAPIQMYMSRHPQIAYLWQTVNDIRGQMLKHAFTFLPFRDSKGQWRVVADYDIAQYMSNPSCSYEEAVVKRLEEALALKEKPLTDVATVCPNATVAQVREEMSKCWHLPVLVVDCSELIGIVTASDLM